MASAHAGKGGGEVGRHGGLRCHVMAMHHAAVARELRKLQFGRGGDEHGLRNANDRWLTTRPTLSKLSMGYRQLNHGIRMGGADWAVRAPSRKVSGWKQAT